MYTQAAEGEVTDAFYALGCMLEEGNDDEKHAAWLAYSQVRQQLHV